MKVLNFKINGVRDYYQTFFSIIQPFSPLSPKEAAILATLVEIRHLMGNISSNVKDIINSDTMEYITKENNITKNNLYVVIASLKKKGVVVDNEIKKQYRIPFESNGGIVFSLKQIDDEIKDGH